MEYIKWDNGKAYIKSEDEDCEREVMYAHFQGRPMECFIDETINEYFVVPNAFVDHIESYNYEEFIIGQQAKFKKKKQKSKIYRIKRKIYLLMHLVIRLKIFNKKWAKYLR